MALPLVPHLINGKDVPASDEATYDVINPLTDEVIYRASAATLEDTNAAIETAYAAWKEWKKWGPTRRRQVLLKAADILESRKDEAIKLLSEEVSAMSAWAVVNVMSGAATFREAATLATHIKGEVVPADRPGKHLPRGQTIKTLTVSYRNYNYGPTRACWRCVLNCSVERESANYGPFPTNFNILTSALNKP
jgi:acyl-CoA reductase-like NAD-dependent aldehyde dehydrogenase